jgi:hypothetical protein
MVLLEIILAQAKACFKCLEIVLVLTQHRCTVCTEHTIGSEIILYAPDKLIGDVGRAESYFGMFGDSVSAGAR